MTATVVLFILFFYLTIVSRLHGGGFVQGVPKWLRNLAWGLPFGVISFLLYYPHSVYLATVCGLGALSLCAAGKALGHGGFTDFGTNDEEREPERVEPVISGLKGEIEKWLYDATGLSLVGLLSVMGGVIPLVILNPLSGLILAIGGALKGPAYYIGWKLYPDGQGKGLKDFDEATEIGEALSGLLVGIAYGIAISLI